MKSSLKMCFSSGTVYVIALCFMLKVQTEEFNGRHVCNQQKTVSQSVPVQQSYRRAVYRNDLQRVVYQTAYRTVFRMQIHAELAPGCCPGWEKRSARDVNCMKPKCNEDCENGGQCVGPGLCICAEGYTGYRCHIDIDECSGRNTCQQKCTNLPGSYECSCQEGFKIANDEYTCELCLNCSKEFQHLQTQIESVQANSKHDEALQEIRIQIANLTEVKMQTDKISDIQKQIDMLNDMAVHDDKYQQLQKQVHTLQNKMKEVDTIKTLTRKVNALQESSLHREKFKKIQKDIENLQEMKGQMDSMKTLNDTIKQLQEDTKYDKKFDDIQQQIEGILTTKAQQNKAQADKLEEMRQQLEQFNKFKGEIEALKDVKSQMEQMSKRIQELETDKAVLTSNLTSAVTQYEAAISALQAREVTTEHVTSDPYDIGSHMPLDRLASLSEQISILEEKMADCQYLAPPPKQTHQCDNVARRSCCVFWHLHRACNQDYSRG